MTGGPDVNEDTTVDERDLARRLTDLSTTSAPQDRLDCYQRVATSCVQGIAELASSESCDADLVAQALDDIDFALGRAVLVLHRD